jgi:hypothetical protein
VTQNSITEEDNKAANLPTGKANKWLLIAGWISAVLVCFIGAVIGNIIQNNASYDESTRQQGKVIRYTAYVVFVLSSIVIYTLKSN